MDDGKIKKLIEKAKETRSNALVPKSNHKIGACILATDDTEYEGCNIEGIISGLGTCAERAAIDHAVIHGKYEYKALVVFDESEVFVCGVCLQYLYEFYQITNKDIMIITATENGDYHKSSLLELLPHGYITEHNLVRLREYHNDTKS